MRNGNKIGRRVDFGFRRRVIGRGKDTDALRKREWESALAFWRIGQRNVRDNRRKECDERPFVAGFLCGTEKLFGYDLRSDGFCFLRIDFSADGAFYIKSIVAASDMDERPQNGEFECDDKLLNEIWSVAARTLRLCLKNGYVWDGIKRDRLVWIGDIYLATKTAHCLFRETPEIKNSLTFCREQTPEGIWMNGIPTYSVWWLYNLCEYFNRTGDEEFVKKNIPFVERIVSDVYACVDERGETHFPYDFIDWASHYDGDEDETKRNDEAAGTNYFIRLVFGRLRGVLDRFDAEIAKIQEVVTRLEKKKYTVRKYKQIAALGALVGEDVEKNVALMLNGGAKGLTTFLNYFIFTALTNNGRQAEVIEMIRAYYGKMLELGATSFWEDFDIEWAENAFGIDKLPVEEKRIFMAISVGFVIRDSVTVFVTVGRAAYRRI